MSPFARGVIASLTTLMSMVTFVIVYQVVKNFLEPDQSLFVAGIVVILNTLNMQGQAKQEETQ